MQDIRREPDHVPHGNALRVLIVDADVEPVLEALYPLRVGGEVAVVGIATTGRGALEQTLIVRPDLILMDPALPDMNGLRVMDAITWPWDTVVVIVSADDTAQAMMRALAAGAHGYLVKPLRPEELYNGLAVFNLHRYGGVGYQRANDRVLAPMLPRRLLGTDPLARGGADGDAGNAEAAARELLRALLTHEEYEQLTTSGYVEVQSRSRAERTYRIPAAGGMVRMLEGGKEVLRLCLQPTTMLPRGDVVLLHKLLLEADEEKYLRTANHFTPAGGRVRRRRGAALA
jgi:DNA-binding NarL/FixJ family response regulator